MVLFIASLAIAAALFYRFLHKRLFNPATIFLGTLGAQLAMFAAMVGPHGYREASSRTLLAVGGGLAGFFLGYTALITLAYPLCGKWMSSRQRFPQLKRQRAIALMATAVFVSLVAMMWHAAVGIDNLETGVTGNALLDLRQVYLNNLDSFSFAPHLAIFGQTLLVYLYLHGHKPRTTMTLLILLTFACAIWKVERSAIVMSFFSALVAFEMRSGSLPLSKIGLVAMTTVAIFIATAMLRDGWESIGDIFVVLGDYFAKNVENFNNFVVDQRVDGNIELLLGKYATVFGAKPASVEVGVDGFFNTYSYLMNVYLFGGVWFPLAFGCIIAVLFGMLYLVSLKQRMVATVYCFASFPLFFAFFDYSFSWTNWAYYTIAAVLIKGLSCIRFQRSRRWRWQHS